MKIGASVRSMGPQSTAATVLECARAAEDAGLYEIWVTDHLAIPPDDAEGSNGRYLDPLVTLAWIAGQTQRIGIGTGIMNLPYRPPLPTAKAVATLQELSGGRLRLGVGVGWMKAEFQALGVDRSKRGQLTDEVLELFERAFANDLVTENGQEFYFRPRPEKPEILIGGMATAARRRAVRFGDAWLPIRRTPEELEGDMAELRELASQAGKKCPAVVLMTGLPLEEPGKARDLVSAYAEIGVERIAHGQAYEDAAEFRRRLEVLSELAAAG